jgi:hypothetical protein
LLTYCRRRRLSLSAPVSLAPGLSLASSRLHCLVSTEPPELDWSLAHILPPAPQYLSPSLSRAGSPSRLWSLSSRSLQHFQ